MAEKESTCGVLTLVSTPIGNLGDITYRGIEELRSADAVLAEDTRRTRKLFDRYAIDNKLIAYHDFNKERVTPRVLAKLEAGENMALVTDAGTPGISDPGFYLVRAAIEHGIRVTVIPGADAVVPALVVSGLPTDAFVFEGFIPRKAAAMRRKLESLAEERRTVIFFVPPHGLVKVLREACDVIPGRRVAVVRELTKIHEEIRRGTPEELLAAFEGRSIRGEIVLLIEGAKKAKRTNRG
jgi:16S rRNA (cytidine1402-2'-O)-methyltransferase